MRDFENSAEAAKPKTTANINPKDLLDQLKKEYRPRILIVDDNTDMQLILTNFLRQEGYEVQNVTDSREALAKLDEFSPDVLCIDYLMPNMDGQELAQKIRSRKDMLYVPIVMLTAVTDEGGLRLSSLESGVDAFLTKPVKREELNVTIRTMLRFKQAQDKMLEALERVAEVQEELLEYERQQGQYEAMQRQVEKFNEDLVAPVNSAEKVVQTMQQLLQQPTSDNALAIETLKTDISEQVQQLQQLLTTIKGPIMQLSKKNQQKTDEFWRS